MISPLFPTDDEDNKKAAQNDTGYVLPNRHGRKIQPLHEDIQAEDRFAPGAPMPASPFDGMHHQSSVVSSDTSSPSGAAPKKHHGKKDASNPAVELIRRKLETLYTAEPDTDKEIQEVQTVRMPQRSKHQQFMYDLSTSGKSLAQIQTEWHTYYIHLPDAEKHQVWQEFYSNNKQGAFGAQAAHITQNTHVVHPAAGQMPHRPSATPAAQPLQPSPVATMQSALPLISAGNPINPVNPIESMIVVNTPEEKTPEKPARAAHVSRTKAAQQATKSAKAIKDTIRKRVNMSAAAQAKATQHLKSLLFGIGTGALVLIVVLFGLFNEMVIAPFIQPSNHASATPIILSADDVAPSTTPEVIIPKISVEIPVDYSLTSNDENGIENALEDGVVHYPSTVHPGEQGNAAFFGHSSNNIFNPGKYKFAFVMLHTLVPGDIFYLTYNDKVYTYKVYDKQIVSPSDVAVLNNVPGKTATATLITCDPPGTSLNRLVVWGEQISPDPSGATVATPTTTTVAPKVINGNGPTLWKRLTGWL